MEGGRGDGVWITSASRAITLYEWWGASMLDEWPQLRASGTHCYGNITVSVFRLGCAVWWGNASDVTSGRQTGERGIHTIGGNGWIGTNVFQTTAHTLMEGTETKEERQTRSVTKAKSSPKLLKIKSIVKVLTESILQLSSQVIMH